MKQRHFKVLIYLLKHKDTTYSDLAREFDVSKKTIERDINCLSLLGIPVYCTQGVGGGVHLDKNYQFGKSFFTEDEIHAMILALSLVDSISTESIRDTLLEKLYLLNPDIVSLLDQETQDYVTFDLLEKPIDINNPICNMINECLDNEVLATIDGVSGYACLEYVIKPSGLHLFAYNDGYHVLAIDDIRQFEIESVPFYRNYLSYKEFKKMKLN